MELFLGVRGLKMCHPILSKSSEGSRRRDMVTSPLKEGVVGRRGEVAKEVEVGGGEESMEDSEHPVVGF
jgi:hypothetical protein